MLSILCIMLAFLLFVIGGWSRWWVADVRGPYYPVLLSSALAFLVLGVWLIPLMVK